MDNKAMRGMISSKFNQRKLGVGQGQSLLEYTMIVVVVIAALSAMSLYVQRSVQANLRIMQDQVNANPVNP